MSISEFCIRNVVCGSRDMPVIDAAALMRHRHVGDALTTIEESASYAETVRRLAVKGVRRMPVVDAAGGLVGIITLDDMLRQLAGPLAALSEVAGRGRRCETVSRT